MTHAGLATLCLQAYSGIDGCALDAYDPGDDGPRVFVRILNGECVVIFRGTCNPRNWLADLDARRVSWGGGKVHRGFLEEWADVRQRVLACVGDRPAVVTGHSLGGAMAVLCAKELGLQCRELVTFGCPRVGNAAFVAALPAIRSTRYVNLFDPVPWVPTLAWGFRHHCPARWYDGKAWGDYSFLRWCALALPAALSAGFGPPLALAGNAEKIVACHEMSRYHSLLTEEAVV